MENQKPNRTRQILSIAIPAALVVIGVAYFLLTSVPATPADGPAAELNPVTIGKGDPKLAFSEAEKAEIPVMVSSGELIMFNKDSHEAWVDAAFWKSSTPEQRQRLVLLLAAVNRDFDGTRQISLKENGSDRTVGEYFAGSLRAEP